MDDEIASPFDFDEEYTDRQRATRACRKHLRDLKTIHGKPPADVSVKRTSVPLRIEPPQSCSYQSSPAELCSEIGDPC